MSDILNMINRIQGGSQPVRQQNTTTPLPTSMDDPRMESAKNYVASHGGNAKRAFYQLCKEKMLNPATIINQLLGNR